MRWGFAALVAGLALYGGGCAASVPVALHPEMGAAAKDPVFWTATYLWTAGCALTTAGLWWTRSWWTGRRVMALAAAFAAMSVAVGWPILSADPREYVLLAHAETLGLNPLRAPYGSIAAMGSFLPMRLAGYPHLLDPYGPVFWMLMRVLGVLPWGAALWVWHGACALAYVGGTWLVVRLYGRRQAGLVALAWCNPVTALLMVGAAHNTVLVALALFGAAYLARGAGGWQGPAAAGLAAVGVCVNLVGIGIAAGLVAYAFRRGGRAGALSVGTFLVAFTALYAPYGPAWRAFTNMLSPAGQMHQAFISLVAGLTLVLPHGAAGIVWMACAGLGALVGWRLVAIDLQRAARQRALEVVAMLGLLPLLCVASVMGWYVVPSMAFGARRPAWVVAGATFAWLSAAGGFQLLGVRQGHLTVTAVAWMSVLSLCLLGAAFVADRLARRREGRWRRGVARSGGERSPARGWVGGSA